MTIQRRFALTFLGIMILFAVNITVFVMGREERSRGFEEMSRALEQEQLINTLKADINDFQRELSLLSGVFEQAGDTAMESPPEIVALGERLYGLRGRMERLSGNAAGSGGMTGDLQECEKLIASWSIVIGNFASDHTAAITELAVTAEPLSQEIIQTRLPRLVQDEKERAAHAKENFYKVSQTNDRAAIITFVISAMLAGTMAYKLSKYVTLGLGRLKRGAVRLGMGELDHRIEVKSADELGALGEAFNKMGERRKVIEDQMRQNQRRYVRQQSTLKALARSSEFHDVDPVAYIAQVAEHLARTMDAARVGFWRLSEDCASIRCEELYQPADDSHASGDALTASDYSNFFRALAYDELIVIDDVRNDPRTNELATGYFFTSHLGALMCVPIRGDHGGERFIFIEHVGEARKWLPDEQTFNIAVSSLVATALGQAELDRVHDELDRALGRMTENSASRAARKSGGQAVGDGSLQDGAAGFQGAVGASGRSQIFSGGHGIASMHAHKPQGLIDEDTLIDRLDGDMIFLGQLMNATRDDAAALIARLRAASISGDHDATARDAHALRGMISYFEAETVTHHAIEMEKAARKRDVEEVRSRCDILEDTLPELFAGLKRIQVGAKRTA